MSAKKSRDLAQELVDFLLKEEKQKKSLVPAMANDKKDVLIKPQLVTPMKGVEADAHIISKTPEAPLLKPLDAAMTADTQKSDAVSPSPTPPALAQSLDEAPHGKSGGFTAIEFNILDEEGPSKPEMSFSDSSEKAKKIISEDSAADLAHKSVQKPALKFQKPIVEKVHLESGEATGLSKSKVYNTQRSRVVVNEVTQLMAGAEAVKVAQARITSLESERDELRSETEELLSTTETLQRRFNELKAKHDTLERKHKERIDILEDEKAVIRARLTAKEEELDRVKKENEDLQMRFKNDLRKIRVRERELEHRQEIMKAEHATVVHSKDEMIIELKRTLERLHFELDNFKAKSADMNTKINEFYERNHRTVKALRLALSVLETGDNEEKPKKVSG